MDNTNFNKIQQFSNNYKGVQKTNILGGKYYTKDDPRVPLGDMGMLLYQDGFLKYMQDQKDENMSVNEILDIENLDSLLDEINSDINENDSPKVSSDGKLTLPPNLKISETNTVYNDDGSTTIEDVLTKDDGTTLKIGRRIDSNGKLMTEYTYGKNEDGEETKLGTWYNSDGSLNTYYEFTYHEENGKKTADLAKWSTKSVNNKPNELDHNFQIEYDESGKEIKRTESKKDGDITVAENYDSMEQLVSEDKYDENNNKISHTPRPKRQTTAQKLGLTGEDTQSNTQNNANQTENEDTTAHQASFQENLTMLLNNKIVKDYVDKDANGKIDEEELKSFIQDAAELDGNASDLSTADLYNIINRKVLSKFYNIDSYFGAQTTNYQAVAEAIEEEIKSQDNNNQLWLLNLGRLSADEVNVLAGNSLCSAKLNSVRSKSQTVKNNQHYDSEDVTWLNKNVVELLNYTDDEIKEFLGIDDERLYVLKTTCKLSDNDIKSLSKEIANTLNDGPAKIAEREYTDERFDKYNYSRKTSKN